jgi:hypothetical protein
MRVTALLPTMASNTLLSGTGQAWFVTKLGFRSKVYCFRTKSLDSTTESNSDASRSNYAEYLLLLCSHGYRVDDGDGHLLFRLLKGTLSVCFPLRRRTSALVANWRCGEVRGTRCCAALVCVSYGSDVAARFMRGGRLGFASALTILRVSR